MSTTNEYIDALKSRIADLEVENEKLRKMVAGRTETIESLQGEKQ